MISRLILVVVLFSCGLGLGENGRCESTENSSINPVLSKKKTGPHGGKILKSKRGYAELKLDTSNKKIHIYLPKHPEKNPTGINAVIYDNNNRSFSVDLKKLEPVPLEGDEMAHYQGELNPNQSSYMGIQISIPFSKDGPAVIEDRNL